MSSIISMVSISLEGFLPSILLLVVIIVAVVIVAVILVVVVINAIVGVVIVVAGIKVVVVVMIIGIVMVDGVTFPSMLWGSPPMKASIIFSVFGTMFGHKMANSWNLLTPGDPIGLFYSDRLSECIPPRQCIIGISLGPVFLLGLSAFAMAAACASKAAATPSVISCRMVASVIVGVADVDVLLGAIYQHIHANTEYRLRHMNNGMSDPIGGLDTKIHQSVVDLTGDEDPSDEDGGTGMGDSIGFLVSLGEIFLEGNKSWESNMGDSDNTRDGG
nr:hypothetical protein [Tanacetum cinerariifolium]